MEEFKAKSHAVKKMTRKGLVETDSREGIVKETAEAKSDGRRINEADFQLERKGAQSRADPVDDKPVSDAASRRKKQMVQKGVRDGNGFNEAVVNDGGFSRKLQDHEGQMDEENLADHLSTIATLPGGMNYDIPPEALSVARFRKMITEAQRYLGYPYVWGGSSPSTSFDCSGFVSWVINHCGNGWNIGRCTAEGLRGHCTYVAPSQAKPGDLIFFQGTYATSGASHVGIYCGDGVMIHCGNPIQFANINSSYWQQHFMCFGRLP